MTNYANFFFNVVKTCCKSFDTKQWVIRLLYRYKIEVYEWSLVKYVNNN